MLGACVSTIDTGWFGDSIWSSYNQGEKAQRCQLREHLQKVKMQLEFQASNQLVICTYDWIFGGRNTRNRDAGMTQPQKLQKCDL